MWKWQQGIVPNHLLYCMIGRLDRKQHFGVMVPSESLDEPQLWVEGCGRGQLRGSELLPNRSGHHTGGCPLINYTPGYSGVPDFDWDLESNGRRKRRVVRLSGVENNHLVISRINSAHGR